MIEAPTEMASCVVTIGELEMILIRAGWQPWVIEQVLREPVSRQVNVNGTAYIVKRA